MPPAPSLSWSSDRNRYPDWLRGFQICQPFGHLPRPLHRSRRDRCPSNDIFSRAVIPMRWSSPTWNVSFSYYIAYAGKKTKKSKAANKFSFEQTNTSKELPFGKYLYGVSSLTRSLISFMSSWIFFTLLSGHRTIYTLRQFCFLCAAPPLLTSYLRKRWLNRRVRFYKHFYT